MMRLGSLRNQLPVLLAILVVLGARSSLADHYVVPSGSMEFTLLPGDRVLVDKTAYGLRLPFTDIELRAGDRPGRGEIAIFDSPADGTRLIKRIVAVGGDRVSLEAGRLSVNGVRPFDAQGTVEHFGPRRAHLNLGFGGGPDIAETVVPAGHVLVIGDARGNSLDSRFFGFVAERDIYARAVRVYFRRGRGMLWLPL
jgi:signal peptidase I